MKYRESLLAEFLTSGVSVGEMQIKAFNFCSFFVPFTERWLHARICVRCCHPGDATALTRTWYPQAVPTLSPFPLVSS